jgi:hypothetical protein
MAHWDRRTVLGTAGSLAMLAPAGAMAAAPDGHVAIVLDPADPVAGLASVGWAVGQLEAALRQRGVKVRRTGLADRDGAGGQRVIVGSFGQPRIRQLLGGAGVQPQPVPEALVLAHVADGDTSALIAAGHDARGLIYALLELVDRLEGGMSVGAALTVERPIVERPHNQVRSVTRMFCSDVEDLPWYHDRDFWRAYLTMLAGQRFNRFNLAFGIGYDFIKQVTDAYFLFTYPFLVSVPGYDVRVPQLSDAERARNLETLKFIGEEAVARGLEFHVGLWMHGYVWIDSPHPNYTIEGLTQATHGPYCRDALKLLLKSVPTISGITMRIHGESGVPEGDFSFWKTVYDGFDCGRPIHIDMHPKGMTQDMLDIALATRQKVSVSPKYWAEHLGMPYHQADIRPQEYPTEPSGSTRGLMKLSGGARNFLRYGYGDLLRQDRAWEVVHRIWPGTQRLLIWGDPETAAAYSRAFTFCGSEGAELCEPLSFKGRRGSGHPGDRCAYADRSLAPRWDWQKYTQSYRVWGRALYDPATPAQVYGRELNARFGTAGVALGQALASASRILPTITTVHAPSAANNGYWPELYFNQSMVDGEHYGPYNDTNQPRIFSHVGAFDPEMFMSPAEAAAELLAGKSGGRYSPLDAAAWLEDYARDAAGAAARGKAQMRRPGDAAYRRLALDLGLQIGTGRFFAAKLRAGVLYALYEQTQSRSALTEAVAQYRLARGEWAALVALSTGAYVADITIGEEPQQRGHWADRLPAIDKDIAAVAALLPKASAQADQHVASAVSAVLAHRPRQPRAETHNPPASFVRGQPLAVTMTGAPLEARVLLRYRHVDQAERFATAVAEPMGGGAFRAAIPARYTDSAFPLEYYFLVDPETPGGAIVPGFNLTRTNIPYYTVMAA